VIARCRITRAAVPLISDPMHRGALPLADGIKAFLLASPAQGGPAPDVVAQLRGLHYDLADTRSPVRFRRC
jgi:hypothetical protein